MSKDNTYNGWTNFETWKINLEVLDDYPSYLIESDRIKETLDTDTSDLSDQIEQYVFDFLGFDECEKDYQLIANYCYWFIKEVNFYEIAEHIKDALKEHLEYETKTA
tara:strand:+ start:66 stop:386 length:321 start_codon:yes stop_codon:yes gene_type:complete